MILSGVSIRVSVRNRTDAHSQSRRGLQLADQELEHRGLAGTVRPYNSDAGIQLNRAFTSATTPSGVGECAIGGLLVRRDPRS